MTLPVDLVAEYLAKHSAEPINDEELVRVRTLAEAAVYDEESRYWESRAKEDPFGALLERTEFEEERYEKRRAPKPEA